MVIRLISFRHGARSLHSSHVRRMSDEPHRHPRRHPVRAIDTHAHWYPREWLDLFQRDGAAEGATLERAEKGYTIRTERIVNKFDDEFVDLERRLAGMDRQGVDVHALSLTAPMVYWASPGFGLALSQAYNDAASAAHVSHPDRFVGMAMVPMQAPELALRELERCARLPGMRGLYVATNVNGANLDERGFWDVYAKAEELGWTVFLHPVDTMGRDRTERYYLKNLLGNPYDTGVAAASLVFGGVLERHPGLKVCLVHGGGFVPYQAGRWAHGWQVRGEPKVNIKQSPQPWIERFYYDTILHSQTSLAFLVGSASPARVLLGSDYPYDMGTLECVRQVKALAISEADKATVLGGEAWQLLGAA